MPVVPRYDQPQETTRAAPLPQMSPAAAGASGRQVGELGQALGQASTDFTRIALDMQERENADRVLRTEAQLKEAETAFHTSINERRGQNAWGATQEATKWWEENSRKLADSLGNDAQRLAFNKLAQQRRAASIDYVSRYEAAQRQQSLTDAAKASIQGSIDSAAAAHADPQIVDSNRAQVQRNVQALAKLQGWAPEAAQLALSEELTKFHSGVLLAKIDEDPDGAREYYAAHKDEIAGGSRPQIEKALRVGTLRSLSQSASEEIIAKGLSESEAVKIAREKYTGDEEDAVVARIKERYTERQQFREQAQRNAADQAWGILARTKRLDQIPAHVIATMDGRDLIALRREAQNMLTGDEVKTDWGTYYDLRQQARENPTQFARTDLRRYFDKLGPSARETLIDMQGQIANGKAHEVTTLERQLVTAHNIMGYGDNDGAQKGQFDAAVTNAINAEQARVGRPLTWDDRQSIIDRMMIQGEVVTGHWWKNDRNVHAYEISGTEDMGRFMPTIPKAERQKIEAALQRRGRPVTDAEVLRLYKQKMGL